MEIKRETIDKLVEIFQEKRDDILREELKGFKLYRTKTGGEIITSKLKNGQGWYALVCFYDCEKPVVDVYDRHVFDRYQERMMGGREDKDPIKEFIYRGNASGTIILKDEGRFEKRVIDGATLGNMKGRIIYHKTYITDTMIVENKKDYLFEL